MKKCSVPWIMLVLLLCGCATPGTEVQVAPTQAVPAQAQPVQTEPAQAAPTQAEAGPAQMANPASENCLKQGGTLSIQERGDGGQYGICLFEDNRQCEEWALLRGDCPAGGLKVTGYITPAAQYCAITGGTYAITGESNTDHEQGTCTFKDGSQCDVWAYYNGVCIPGTVAGEWQTFTNPEAGYSLQAPPTWNQQPLPDQNQGAIHGTGYSGPEGGVEVYWGTGFGGACTTGTEPVQLAQGQLPACHATNSDGTETWSQIGYQVSGGSSFSVRAYTSSTQPSSRDLVLQVLSTLTFMPSAQGSISTPNAGGGAEKIVFDSNRDGGYRDLYIMKSLGYDVRRLTQGESNSFAGPWSPDGQRIVYTTFGLTNSTIAVINADGSGQQTLSEVQGSDEGFPDWSPDGQRIAFTTRRDGNNEIYLINEDGSHPVRLTNHPADDFAPSWSPDGTQIVFVSDRTHKAGIYDLFIMNADGSGVRQLTNDTAIDYSPDWSPDGKQIVFRSHHDGPGDIYLINVDGSGLTNLTNDRAEDWAPSWSPDGSLIAFQTNRDGNWEIYRMTPAGTELANLTNDPADDQLPYYQP